VFRLAQPSASAIGQALEAAKSLPCITPRFLHCSEQFLPKPLPLGFARDRRRTLLGNGQRAFEAAQAAFKRWVMFDLGWARVVNTEARMSAGQLVAVEADTLGLWTLNVSQIVDVMRSASTFGFVYATTFPHVEEGEERFLLEFNPECGEVWYDLEAVSRPRATLARFGYPITRHFQHRFARESHARMLEEVRGGPGRATN
jgi:uncharacterized protein (UPF0548 family)